jgi:hypothetical protein
MIKSKNNFLLFKVSNLQHHHHHHHLHQHISSQSSLISSQQTQINQNELSSPTADIHNTNYWKPRKHQLTINNNNNSNTTWNDTNNINMSNNSTLNSPNGNKISLKINKIAATGESN